MRELPRYEYEGKMLTAGEIAAKTGIKQSIISSRLHAGKRGKALTEPPVRRSEAATRAAAAMHGGTIKTAK